MDQVNWGIIGCGDVTEFKSGPAINKIPHSRLVAVMRRDREKARDYAQRHGVPKWTTDAEELLHDPDVNAIYVATPPDTHAHYTIQAAQADKAVYVEKPMALNRIECEAMIAACKRARVPLFVAYYRRCLPGYLKIKDLIATGTIGTVRLVTIRMVRSVCETDRQKPTPWRLRPELAGGGHFVDLAPHQLDFLDFLFGPVTEAQGQALNQAGVYPAEDVVGATLTFSSGVLAVGSWCFTAAPCSEQDQIEIVGSRGRLTFATFNHDIPITLETDQGLESFPMKQPQHIQQPMLTSVVAALRGRGTCPSTGESGARTTWVLDQILQRYRYKQP
jgi:predicted dehydrogenase